MFVTENSKEGFHTKGYIFRQEEMYRIIVGSSNMTLSALTTNREWNTKIVFADQGEYTQNVVAEFEQLWNAQQSFGLNSLLNPIPISNNIDRMKNRKKIRLFRACLFFGE